MKVQGKQRSFQAWISSGCHLKSRAPALVSRGEVQNCEYQVAAHVQAESSYWNTLWIVLQKGNVALFELSNVISRVSSFKRLGWGKGSLFPLTRLMCQSLRCSEISWCPHPTKELQCKTPLHPFVLLSWICYSVPPTNCASQSLLFMNLMSTKPHTNQSWFAPALGQGVGGTVWVWAGKKELLQFSSGQAEVPQSLHIPSPGMWGKKEGTAKEKKCRTQGWRQGQFHRDCLITTVSPNVLLFGFAWYLCTVRFAALLRYWKIVH